MELKKSRKDRAADTKNKIFETAVTLIKKQRIQQCYYK